MKYLIPICVFTVISGVAGAADSAHPAPEQWFMVQAPVSISVDTASIEIQPSGIRRARVKLDMSHAPSARNEPAKRLMFDVAVIAFDCKKQTSRMESGESHFADGTVTVREGPKSEDIWLRTDTEVAMTYVCAWSG